MPQNFTVMPEHVGKRLKVTAVATNSNGSSLPVSSALTAIVASGTLPSDTTAPTITSSNSTTIDENTKLAFQLTADEPVTWSIASGSDAAHLEIVGSILRWKNDGTMDYENPLDNDKNNAYALTVRATDAAGNSSTKSMAVNVRNVSTEGPVVEPPPPDPDPDPDPPPPVSSTYDSVVNAPGGLVGHFRLNESSTATTFTDRVNTSRTVQRTSHFAHGGRPSMHSDTSGGAVMMIRNVNAFLMADTTDSAAYDFAANQAFSGHAFVADNIWWKSNSSGANLAIASKMEGGTFGGWNFGVTITGTGSTRSVNLYFRLRPAGGSTNNDLLVRTTNNYAEVGTVTGVGFSYDGSKNASGVKLYINGVSVAVTVVRNLMTGASNTATLNAGRFCIGGGSNGTTHVDGFSGAISEFALYNKVLTDSQFSSLAQPRKTFSFVNGVSTSVFPNPTQPVNLIHMDDCDGDPDGYQQLAVAFSEHANGFCKIIGIATTTPDLYVAPAIEALRNRAATKLNKSDIASIPIAAWQGGTDVAPSDTTYVRHTAQKFTPGKTRANYPDSTVGLRTWLAAAPNNSVVINEGGGGHCFDALLKSPADSISSLNGRDLVAAKVRFFTYTGNRSDGVETNNRTGVAEAAFMQSGACPVPFVYNTWNTSVGSGPSLEGPTVTSSDYSSTGGGNSDPWKFIWAAAGVLKNGGNMNLQRNPGDIFGLLYAIHGRARQGTTMFVIDRWEHMLSINPDGRHFVGAYPGAKICELMRAPGVSTTVYDNIIQPLINKTMN